MKKKSIENLKKRFHSQIIENERSKKIKGGFDFLNYMTAGDNTGSCLSIGSSTWNFGPTAPPQENQIEK